MKYLRSVLALLFISFTLAGCTWSTGKNGEHTGYVTAVQQTGIIYKNYRVFVKTDKASSQEDVYCLRQDNYSLAEELRKAQRHGYKVTVKYDSQDGFTFSDCLGDYVTGLDKQE